MTTRGMSEVTSASYTGHPRVIHPRTPHLGRRVSEWIARGTTIWTWLARTCVVSRQKAVHSRNLYPRPSFLNRGTTLYCGLDGERDARDGVAVPELDSSCMPHATGQGSSVNSLPLAIDVNCPPASIGVCHHVVAGTSTSNVRTSLVPCSTLVHSVAVSSAGMKGTRYLVYRPITAVHHSLHAHSAVLSPTVSLCHG